MSNSVGNVEQLDWRVLTWARSWLRPRSRPALQPSQGLGPRSHFSAGSLAWLLAEGLISLPWDSTLIGCPHDMVANFPRKSRQKERERGRISAFLDLVSEGTHCLFIRILSLHLAHTLPLKEGDDQRICRLHFQIVIRDCWFIVLNCPPVFLATVAWVCLCLSFLGPAPWLHGC